MLEHLLSKIITLRHFPRLMISTQEEDLRWELDLQSEEVSDALRLELSPVDIVAHEQPLLACLSKLLLAQQFNEVIVLPVNIANDEHLAGDPEQVRLRAENLCRLRNDGKESLLRQHSASILVVLD